MPCGAPRCDRWAASAPGRIRLRKPARRPGPPPSFYLRPGLLAPGGDLLVVALGRSPGRDLHAPPEAVQQQVQPGQGVGHAEALADDRGDARQRPALVVPAPRRRVGVQQVLQLGQLGGAEPAATPRPAPWRTAPGARRGPARGAMVWPTSGPPGTGPPPPGRWPLPRSTRPRPAAPVPAGRTPRRSAHHPGRTSWLWHSPRRADCQQATEPPPLMIVNDL